MVSPSASSGQALKRVRGERRRCQPGRLQRVCRDTPRGSRAEEEVDRCSLIAADVSSFRVNVFTFGPDVSTFRANVSSLRPNVFSRG